MNSEAPVNQRELLDHKLLAHPDVREYVLGELEDKTDLLQHMFDNALQRRHGDVDVCGIPVKAAHALYNLEPAIYQARLKQYVEMAMAVGDVIYFDGVILQCDEIKELLDRERDGDLKNLYREVYRLEHEDE